MRLLSITAFFLLITSCGEPESTAVSTPETTKDTIVENTDMTERVSDSSNVSPLRFTTEVFETPGLGWGYKIYQEGVLFINQPHIPAIQGNKGFATKEKAQITADFAIHKLNQGFIPPTISPEELDSLGVLD